MSDLAVQLLQFAEPSFVLRMHKLPIEDVMTHLVCSKEEARQVIEYVVRERELDLLAGGPSGIEFIDARANAALYQQLEMIIEDNDHLEMVLHRAKEENLTEMDNVLLPGYPPTCAANARLKMQQNLKTILEIKKATVSSKVAEKENAGVHLEVNLGSIMDQILDPIRPTTKVIDMV